MQEVLAKPQRKKYDRAKSEEQGVQVKLLVSLRLERIAKDGMLSM